MTLSEDTLKARAFLAGERFPFADVNALWERLRKQNELSIARAVLARIREPDTLSDTLPSDHREKLCQQEALLTSKDPEISAAVRHDRALAILAGCFTLGDSALDGDGETLGIAGGIYKRRWNDLGRLEDLVKAANLYERGALGPTGDDAYPHINAAFLDDLLANAGEEPERRRQRAKEMRERILRELPPLRAVPDYMVFWNAATRAEANFGLRRYDEARAAIQEPSDKPAPWQLETTARQLATLANLQEPQPLEHPGVRAFFEALLMRSDGTGDGDGGGGMPRPSSSAVARAAIQSVIIGKVGLALSGGGFRASFYHLGVLARLAELDVLRHVEVLSCVSGGSIVGACYWLALRRRLLQPTPMQPADYITLVQNLISHFRAGVDSNIRAAVQGSILGALWRFLTGSKGAMDTELTASALEDKFYRSFLPGTGPLYMHELPFNPSDHDKKLMGSARFNPTKHNWLRANKVPALVLNATTVNTGHAWQFTPTWMGESPWAIHEAADSIPRLEWSEYDENGKWQITIGRAVAASACVPFVFEPLAITDAYKDLRVGLVDGGVHDNQGTVSLLASSCNVVIVSDAAGQLLLESAAGEGIRGLAGYANRNMGILMERIRLANFADLAARKQSGLLRGLMFLHMKAGLDAEPIPLSFSQTSFISRRTALSPSGVRKEFQQALSDLRTDLDAFTANEANALMACGYQMASKTFERDLGGIRALWTTVGPGTWPFGDLLTELTSTALSTRNRDGLLQELRAGSTVHM